MSASHPNWNEFADLCCRLGGEPPLDENGNLDVATADHVYFLALEMGEHEFRCGFYAACKMVFPEAVLASLAQLQAPTNAEWLRQAAKIVGRLQRAVAEAKP